MDVKRLNQKIAQGEATRAAFLAAARELFGEQGFAATDLEDIVARAGVEGPRAHDDARGRPAVQAAG